MSKIAYVPFADQGLRNYVSTTINTFNSGRMFDRFKTPPRYHGGPILRDVGINTQVYVFGHGSPKSDVISDNSGNQLTMDELAVQLLSDGLSLAHKVIKLNACNGGTGGLQSMANKLLMAMRGAGFPAVKVYGYTENLYVKSWGSQKHGTSGARAKDIRVKFK